MTKPTAKRTVRPSPISLTAAAWKTIADDRTTIEELRVFMLRILTVGAGMQPVSVPLGWSFCSPIGWQKYHKRPNAVGKSRLASSSSTT